LTCDSATCTMRLYCFMMCEKLCDSFEILFFVLMVSLRTSRQLSLHREHPSSAAEVALRIGSHVGANYCRSGCCHSATTLQYSRSAEVVSFAIFSMAVQQSFHLRPWRWTVGNSTPEQSPALAVSYSNWKARFPMSLAIIETVHRSCL